MNQIKLKSILIENFKGIKNLAISFGDKTAIFGRNASGKTTIADAFFWLLFNKDSTGSSQFAIRPKDENGNDIDNIEIKVEATLDVDGEELTLTKVQKQKWTKHRGSNAPTFEGNVNENQINGFPASKSEYEEKIRSLIDESLFKLLTNPKTFASMKWQDQRQMLLEFVSDITDESILDIDKKKYEPIRKDVLAAGADKAREKANLILRKLKKEQLEYPVRIDEAMRNINGNVSDEHSLMEQKRKAEEELQAVQNERNSLFAASDVLSDIQNQIFSTKVKMGDIERSAMVECEKKRSQAIAESSKALRELRDIEFDRDDLGRSITTLERAVEFDKKSIADLATKYKEAKAREFPESQTICPTCGRPFDGDRIEKIREDFESRKAEEISNIDKNGKAIRARITENEKAIESKKSLFETIKTQHEAKNNIYENLRTIADRPVDVDVTTIPEYVELKSEYNELNKKLASLRDSDNANNAVKERLFERESAAKDAIEMANVGIAWIEANKRTHERIEELKEEQKDCGQRVADQERIVYLLDEFIKLKMDYLSGKINSHFNNVRFRLFTEQINGGIKETCTMQINSNGSYVDYSDANNAAKIIGGMDVIEALSKLYGVTAPILLDNAECLDGNNKPKVEAQLILLEVSDDKEIRVERW